MSNAALPAAFGRTEFVAGNNSASPPGIDLPPGFQGQSHGILEHFRGEVVLGEVVHVPAHLPPIAVHPELVPLALLTVFRLANVRWWYLTQFLAGFCLIANGAYLGVGSFDKIGDTGEMLRQGCPAWCLWLFGLTAVPLGLFLWHGLGRHFGLARNDAGVDRGAAYASCGLLLVTLLLEFALSPR